MFSLRNKKNNFQLRTLIWGPGAYGISVINSFLTSKLLSSTDKCGSVNPDQDRQTVDPDLNPNCLAL